MAQEKQVFAQRRPTWQMQSLNLEDLQLDSFEPLEKAPKRQPCPQCGRSRALFCYNCLVPFTSTPNVKLPFQLHIITHASEAAAKATGTHAGVLCKGQVHLQSLEELPTLDRTRSVVMFPSDDAVLPEQLPVEQLEHIIIIDSKWRKAKELNGHPVLEGMKRVKLPGNPRSTFWRYHTEGVTDEGVCTIEALHLLMRAMAFAGCYPEPAAYWDNLLWYYAYQHKVVEKASTERETKRKLREQQGGYAKQKRRRQREEQQGQQQQDQQQQPPESQLQTENQGQHQGQQQLESQPEIELQAQQQLQQQQQASQQEPPQLQQHQASSAGDTGCKTDSAAVVQQQRCLEAAGST